MTAHTTTRTARTTAGCLLATVALAAALAGCGTNSAATGPDVVRGQVARKLPKGWQISYAHEVNFPLLPPTKADDLVVWRTEKAKLQDRPDHPAPAEPAALYYTLSPRPFIDPAKYRELFAKNEEIRKEHERVLHSVQMVPRNDKGELMPRGVVEELAVKKFKEEYAKLPPFDADMPTHYCDDAAIRLHDYRPVLVPEDRLVQQDMNTAYVAIIGTLKAYK